MAVQEVASVTMNNTLTIGALTGGFNDFQPGIGTKRTLHYVSVAASGSTHSVTVQWADSNQTPAAISLELEARVPPGCGVTGGRVNLSDAACHIITGIGTCSTARGGDGAELAYTLNADQAPKLATGDSNNTPTIMFTLIED